MNALPSSAFLFLQFLNNLENLSIGDCLLWRETVRVLHTTKKKSLGKFTDMFCFCVCDRHSRTWVG